MLPLPAAIKIMQAQASQKPPGNMRWEFGVSALRCTLVRDYAPAPQSEHSGRFLRSCILLVRKWRSNSHLSPPALTAMLVVSAHLSCAQRYNSTLRQSVSRRAKSTRIYPEGKSAGSRVRFAVEVPDGFATRASSERRQSSSVYAGRDRLETRSAQVQNVHGLCVGGAVETKNDRRTTPGDRRNLIQVVPVYASSFAST
jgi:hypothetical protein